MSNKKEEIFINLYNEKIEKLCKIYNTSFYLSYTFMIIILILIIISFKKIENSNCECANIPEKRFIKEWFIIALILSILFILLFILGSEPCYIKFIRNNYLFLYVLLFGLINYIMLFRLLLYLRIMRNKCKCGYGNMEKFLFWYLIIIFSLIALLILILTIIIIIILMKLINK